MKCCYKIAALLLVLIMCLCLAACSDDAQDDQDVIVGDDWRVTGVVKGSGTITRGGEDTDVLVCLGTESAEFYYDSYEQVLFDGVDFPTAIENDVLDTLGSIDFADRTGDGNSDVAMIFGEGDDMMLLVWFWDKDSDSFVFQPDESQLAASGETGE